jgi:hypothetical protein
MCGKLLTISRQLAVAACLLAWMVAAQIGSAPASSDPNQDPLSLLGYRATEGAAAGYVLDRACSTCHMAKYLSYQHVGMARSFARPSQAVRLYDSTLTGRDRFSRPSFLVLNFI